MSNVVINMFVGDIQTAPPFRDLFPIDEKVLEAIYWDLQKHGFDPARPIILWESHGSVVIDGHTRLRAARKAGLCQVPVMLKYFADEEDALQYAIGSQRNRRNLKDSEILKCIEELDKRRSKIANLIQNRTEAPHGASGKSSSDTASLLGISERKVERARTVMDRASADVKAAVQSGKMSINAAYNQTVGARNDKPEPPALAEAERKKLGELLALVEEELDTRLLREFIKLLAEKILKSSAAAKLAEANPTHKENV